MRKLVIYIVLFVLLCFFIPVIFTRKPETKTIAVEENQKNNVSQEEVQTYTYKNYGKVKLLHTATDEVQELNMDEYLYRSCCC